MRKIVSLLLILTLLLGACCAAFSEGAGPSFTQQPVDSTTDKYGNLSLIFKGENFTPNDSSWHFKDPDSGNEWTGPQLREEMKARKQNNFSLTASEGKQKLFLTGVPKFMHRWEVYVVLVKDGIKVESEHKHIYWYGLDPNTKYDAAAAAAAKNTKTADSGKKTDGKTTAADGTVNPDGTAATEPEVDPNLPKIITVTASKVTLCPVDSRGNALEDKAASTLQFENQGSVAVISESPVKYWIVNGIRIEPTDSLTGFVLKNVTTDLSISAKFQKSATTSEDEIDMSNLVTVTCSGCTFTWHKGGLRSVTEGEVAVGATIVVFTEDAKPAARGFTVDGVSSEYVGKASFQLKVEDDVTISVP